MHVEGDCAACLLGSLDKTEAARIARAVIDAVTPIIEAGALEALADELDWKPERDAKPCDNPEPCCGSAASCDGMQPMRRYITATGLRARAERGEGGDTDATEVSSEGVGVRLIYDPPEVDDDWFQVPETSAHEPGEGLAATLADIYDRIEALERGAGGEE